jgi:hypothetical protein
MAQAPHHERPDTIRLIDHEKVPARVEMVLGWFEDLARVGGECYMYVYVRYELTASDGQV